MKLCIGIDTGGTCTDAAIYDYDTGRLLAKAKTNTTRDDLSLCVGKVLDLLPRELLSQCFRFNLSTTLATNACVENKGTRAKLVILGTNRNTMSWINADKAYGLRPEEVLCVETSSSFDGKRIDMPDWEQLCRDNAEWFSEAGAIAVAEVYGTRNGGVCELEGCRFFREKYGVPAVASVSLSNGLNVMERGATALLNARLITIIDEYVASVKKAAEDRDIKASRMTVRSDGSLMSTEFLTTNPVSAILSGPAASVRGSRALAKEKSCLVIDMGGTTTDIAVIRDGRPLMHGGVKIGGFRTHVRGVSVETVGLGGDSRTRIIDGRPVIDSRRVEPMCMLLSRFPELKKRLEKICFEAPAGSIPMYEALYLMKVPDESAGFTAAELQVTEVLKEGPVFLGEGKLDLYNVKTDRLESEGIIMRCGMTPTDFMHIRGDFTIFDGEASAAVAGYMLRQLSNPYNETYSEKKLQKLTAEVFGLVNKKLYCAALEMLIKSSYPEFASGLGSKLSFLVEDSWEKRDALRPDFKIGFESDLPIVGVGAPIHVFLPEVAKALGVDCILPENAEVANAVGAAVADIEAVALYEISPDIGRDNYTVRGMNVCASYAKYESALERAKEEARRQAEDGARRRGAEGIINCEIIVHENTAVSKNGFDIYLGTTVEAIATCSL